MKSLEESQSTYVEEEANKSSLIKCSQGEDAYKICSDHKCQIYAFMCLEENCECNIEHERCLKILIESFKAAIENKLVSYKPIEEKIKLEIQKSIDDLSKLEEELLKQCKEKESELIGLNNVEKWLVSEFSNGNIEKTNITGRYIYNVLKNLKKPSAIIKITETLSKDIDRIWNEFDSDIKKLENKLKMTIQNFGFNFFKNSNVIKNSNEENLVANFFTSQRQNILSVQLLYRGSDHQFLASKFHELCDGKTDTITICENTFGKKFGGFTPLAWKSGNEQLNDNSGKSFVFSLTNNHKFINETKTNTSIGNANYGPIFGTSKADIVITDKCNLDEKSFCNPNQSYKNENYKENDKDSQFLMTSVENDIAFKVKEYEVWKVNFVQ